MAEEASGSSGSADSYIGSLISLTSKSEIRYEGVLFNINAAESSIGLRNVRSFGSEGRKKDGPQIPPSDKVFEYILFRGSDIKDLQVKASPPVQTPAPIYNDPAIIQSHYPQATPTSTSFPSQLPLYRPSGSSGSWASSLPLLIPNENGPVTPLYWQGYYGPSNGPQQQQSLPQPPPALLIQPSMQHSMQYPAMNASSTLPLQSSALTLESAPVLMSHRAPTQVLPPTLGSIMPSAPPLSTVQDTSAIPPVVPEKPKLDFASTVPYDSVSGPQAYVAGTSGSFLNEGSTPYLVTPDQLLPPRITKASSSQSSQAVKKEVDNFQAPSSEPPLPTFTESQVPTMPRPSTIDQNSQIVPRPPTTDYKAPIMSRPQTFDHKAPIMPRPPTTDHKAPIMPRPPTTNHKAPRMPQPQTADHKAPIMPRPPTTDHKLREAPSHTYHNGREGHGRVRGNEFSEAPSHTHQDNRGGYAIARGNEFGEAPSHTHRDNRGRPGRARGNGFSEAHSHSHQDNRGGCGRSRGNGTYRPVTRFNEDFDFTAMNEKFNKEEVWGDLGKSSKAQENGDGSEDEDDEGPPELESKPVYVKDDFFDSLSCDSLGSRSGRTKFSDQMKVDTETFGDFSRHRGGGRGGRGFGRIGYSRGGRGHGYYRRGRGNRGHMHGMAEPQPD